MPTKLDDNKTLSDAELLNMVRNSGFSTADEAEALKYTPEPRNEKRRTSITKKLARKISKKQAYGAGGIVGLLLSATLVIASFGSGPLELIHLSEILHLAHFAQQEAAGDGRLAKALRNLSKTGGNASDTEISEIVDTYHGEITSDLASIGIKPQYNADGSPSDTFTVDTEDANSPYKGMTAEEAAQSFETRTGIAPRVNGASLEVNANDFWGSTEATDKSFGLAGLKGIATAARTRFMNAFGLASMHPLHATKGESQAQADKNFNSELKDFVDNGEGTISDNTAAATEEDTVNGKTTSIPDPGNIDVGNMDQTTNMLKNIASSGSIKVAGSGANVLALMCALQMVYKNIDVVDYLKYFAPAMRLAMTVMSIGYQIKSGQDINTTEIGAVLKNMEAVDGHGRATAGIFDSQELQSDEGNRITGVSDPLKLNGTYNALKKGAPDLSFADSAPVRAMCSPVGEDFTTGITAVTAFSGGAVTLAASTIIGALAGKYVISEITHLLGSDIMEPTLAGPTGGANSDYGALASADETAIHSGASVVTPQQAGQLTYLTRQQAKQAFDSESFFARVFDINNYQSLAGRLADDVFTSSAMSSVSGLASDILSSASMVIRLPFTIFSSIVSADAPQSSYAYPFPEFNFTEKDLNNSTVGNPYKNASYVAHVLDTSCLNNDGTTNSSCSYISQAESCFGDLITKDNTKHVWDVIPNQPVNFSSRNYNTALCKGDGVNNTWLRFRVFILDTGVIEGYACVDLHDPVSCSNNGTSGNDTNTESSSGSSAFTGITSSYEADMATILSESTSW